MTLCVSDSKHETDTGPSKTPHNQTQEQPSSASTPDVSENK